MAKADLKKVEQGGRELTGKALTRCFEIAGLSQKEAAALVNRNPSQVARWLAGTETAPLHVLLSVRQLHGPLVIALAEVTQAAAVTTHIEVTR